MKHVHALSGDSKTTYTATSGTFPAAATEANHDVTAAWVSVLKTKIERQKTGGTQKQVFSGYL